jgi:hypothetical protein
MLRRIDPTDALDFIYASIKAKSHVSLVPELDQLFDLICSFFVRAEEAGREEVVSFFRQRIRLLGNLHNYAARSANRLEETGDSEFLLRGLAAVVLDGGRSLQNFGGVLAKLYLAAKRRGFQPMPHFLFFGELSNSETRKLLANFENSYEFGRYVETIQHE